MSQVIKAFLGLFFMISLILLGSGILAAQMDVSDALDYKADIIAELENSNFNSDVLNACIRQAQENGYKLEVKTFSEGGASVCYTDPSAVDTKNVVMAEVKLTYPYRIGFLNAVTEHQVRGFAR